MKEGAGKHRTPADSNTRIHWALQHLPHPPPSPSPYSCCPQSPCNQFRAKQKTRPQISHEHTVLASPFLEKAMLASEYWNTEHFPSSRKDTEQEMREPRYDGAALYGRKQVANSVLQAHSPVCATSAPPTQPLENYTFFESESSCPGGKDQQSTTQESPYQLGGQG